MIFKKNLLIILFMLILPSCAEYKANQSNDSIKKKYFTSKGFALIYEDELYIQKVVNKRIKNNEIYVLHDLLKKNTPIKIVNPDNSKFIDTKIFSKASYPNIFNVVITENIATYLGLDINNPYVEIFEIKKNKKFVAKESNIFEEEINVAEKAPISEIKVDDLSVNKIKKKPSNKSIFILVISDFYYEVSAIKLKKELSKKTSFNNIFVKKINNTKYRLSVGPFENFNALKTTYISLNNLGFEVLNIYKE